MQAFRKVRPTSGQVTSMITAGGDVLTLERDGALPTRLAWTGAVDGAVTVAYDERLLPASVTVQGEQPIELAYDADGQLTAAGPLALTRHPGHGAVTGLALGGLGTTITHDEHGDSTSAVTSHGGTTLYQDDTSRDLLGRATARTETVLGEATAWGYRYDPAGRLIEVTRDGAAFRTYAYDANGNRTASGVAGLLAATFDAQDRILGQGSTTYTHDRTGRRTSATTGGQTTTYSYDERGDLLAVGLDDGRTVTYRVDAQGRRIARSVDGARTAGWLYLGETSPVAQLDAAGQVTQRYVYGSRANVPDAILAADGTRYGLVTDERGSVRLVVDAATGAVAQRIDYDPFGVVLTDTNPGFQPFGFAGGLYDPDTGLVRFGARDYDPATGRWTAKDPILFDGGDTNLYAYVGGDPVNRTDPTGLIWKWISDAWDWWNKTETIIDVTDTAYQVADIETDETLSDPEKAAGILSCMLDWVDRVLPVNLVPSQAANKALDKGMTHARHQRDHGTINRGAARQLQEVEY